MRIKKKYLSKKVNLFSRFILTILLLSLKPAYTQNFWQQVADFNSSPACFSFDSTNNIFLGTLDQGVFYSSNNGITWTGKSSGLIDMNIYSIAYDVNGHLLAGTFNHGVFISTNNGNLWAQSGLTLQSKIRAIAITQNHTYIAGSDGNGIYRSTNNGLNWQKMNSPLNVYSLCVTPPGYVIAGSKDPDCLYASLDDGITWQVEYSNSNAFNSIASTPDGTVYSVNGNFTTDNPLGYILVKSDNFGMNWVVASSFSSSSYGVTVNRNGDVFIGRYYNVWRSSNEGINWVTLSSGIDSSTNVLISLACSPQGYIFTGRQGGQLFRSSGSTIAVQKISSQIPESFKLYQNYPNPFNPVTKLKFDIPNEPLPFGEGKGGGVYVKLIIYDILGREVATLVNKPLHPGTYEITLDGSGFSSGIYFYSLYYSGYTKTLPMILIK
ncbi:MAG: hypothetical protein ACHQJ4_06260 [Ignavibacteria bacterium]